MGYPALGYSPWGGHRAPQEGWGRQPVLTPLLGRGCRGAPRSGWMALWEGRPRPSSGMTMGPCHSPILRAPNNLASLSPAPLWEREQKKGFLASSGPRGRPPHNLHRSPSKAIHSPPYPVGASVNGGSRAKPGLVMSDSSVDPLCPNLHPPSKPLGGERLGWPHLGP